MYLIFIACFCATAIHYASAQNISELEAYELALLAKAPGTFFSSNCSFNLTAEVENTLWANIAEEEKRNISVTMTMNFTGSSGMQNYSNWQLSYEVKSTQEDVLSVIGKSGTFAVQDEQFEFRFLVRGEFIGFSEVNVETWLRYTDENGVNGTCNLNIKKKMGVVVAEQKWMVFFMVVMAMMVFFNYINMGVQLDLKMVKDTLRRPIGPVIGFISQFTIMPLASYAYGKYLLDDPLLRMGLFILGCSPGGNSSNLWTLMFNGDINLSITMTFVSALASLGMMPLWIYTLGKQVIDSSEVSIPFGSLVQSLVLLTIPILVGIFVKYKLPRVAKISRKILRPMSLFIAVVGIGVSSATNSYIYLLFTWETAGAGISVAVTGYALGALLAILARLKGKQVVAVSIETAFQNSSISFVLMAALIESPARELMMTPVIMQLMVTQLPLLFVFIVIKIKDRWCCPKGKMAIGETPEAEGKGAKSNDIPLEENGIKGSYIARTNTEQETTKN